MELSTLLNKMTVFIGLMLIGWFLAKRGTIGPDFIRAASRLVVNVFLVGTILSSILSTGTDMDLLNFGELLLLTSVAQGLGCLISAAVMRFVRLEPGRAPVYEVLMGLGNTMFIALPIAQAVCGDYAVLILSVSCIPFNLLLYSWGVWRMKGGGSARGIRFREMLSVPLIATVAGVALLLLKIPVPAAVRELLAAMGNATMPLSMIVVGASMGSVSLLDAFRDRHLALLSGVKLLLQPSAVWLVCGLMTDDPALRMTCMILSAAPSAVVVSVLAIQYGRDEVYASQAVQHSTICSMVTIPLLIRLFSLLQ